MAKTPTTDPADQMIEDYADEATPDHGRGERSARANAIRDLVDRGYKSGREVRKVHSVAHAEFLIRAGVVDV